MVSESFSNQEITKSQYHVDLDKTQEEAERRFERLQCTDILLMGPVEFKARIQDYIKEEGKERISSMRGFQECSPNSEEGPIIIGENEASFCTLLLAFNEEGDAMVDHLPLASLSEGWLEMYEDRITDMKTFARKTGGQLLITGTNSDVWDREKVLSLIVGEDSDIVTPLFTKHENVRVGDAEHSYIMNKDNIQGICFVPKQLAHDDRNKIFLIASKFKNGKLEEAVNPGSVISGKN